MVSFHADSIIARLETSISPTISWRQLASEAELLHGTGLTPAEQVVVVYLLQGLSNKEIARILGKSVSTVKNQVSSCLSKIGVPTRSRLIVRLR